jgi:deazaflavin-dependent oxidoreductase (nitroreductase family)
MRQSYNTVLPKDLVRILDQSFVIQITATGRRSGLPRTFEVTYVWDGDSRIYVSGYPGKRDWVANLAASPAVVVHTVQGEANYDIPAIAYVIKTRKYRLPHILDFIKHWAARMGPFGIPFRIASMLISVTSFLNIPFWGPLFPVRLLIDRMPCVEISFSDPPIRTSGSLVSVRPPSVSE